MATYSGKSDLLIGDTTIGGGLDAQKFVQDATDEINSRIGAIYTLPLGATPEHITLTLKRCANLIASGRLLLAVGAGGEDLALHAYGESLVREGQAILDAIANGQIELGVDKVPTQTEGNAPSIINQDSASGVEAFYDYVNGLSDPGLHGAPIWRSGAQ